MTDKLDNSKFKLEIGGKAVSGLTDPDNPESVDGMQTFLVSDFLDLCAKRLLKK